MEQEPLTVFLNGKFQSEDGNLSFQFDHAIGEVIELRDYLTNQLLRVKVEENQ